MTSMATICHLLPGGEIPPKIWPGIMSDHASSCVKNVIPYIASYKMFLAEKCLSLINSSVDNGAKL